MNLKTRITTASRILMVDDEDSNVVVLERLLRQAGYTNIFGSTDSRMAETLYNQISPDILFLDLHMPDPNGFELLDRFSKTKTETGDHVPILVLTADITPGTKLKALALGANAVMVGRTTRWGLAAFGTAGAQRLIEMLQQELVQVAAAAGCAKLSDINKNTVRAHFV